jgi:hypothetical protein
VAARSTSPPVDWILIALLVRGRSSASALADVLGCEESAVRFVLQATGRTGTVANAEPGSAAQLTDDGRRAALQMVVDAVSDAAALNAVYEADYLLLNDRVKHLCSEWQLRRGTSRAVNALRRAHDAARVVLREMAVAYPRISIYERRLTRAAERFASGDERYVASPWVDSYHSAWFECHAELMLALGRQPDEGAR